MVVGLWDWYYHAAAELLRAIAGIFGQNWPDAAFTQAAAIGGFFRMLGEWLPFSTVGQMLNLTGGLMATWVVLLIYKRAFGDFLKPLLGSGTGAVARLLGRLGLGL